MFIEQNSGRTARYSLKLCELAGIESAGPVGEDFHKADGLRI
jgi:hypothetical protein